MRVLVTADLHYQPSCRTAYVEFARWVTEQQPDCFILAGDVGHPQRLFRRGLQLFSHLSCPRLLIAGNHDLYRSEVDSRTLWEVGLPAIAAEEGFHWLEEQSVRLGSVGICGTMAWYDYSARAAELPLSHSELRTLKGLVNHDADYIDWPWSDRTVARFLGRRFVARLNALQSDPAVAQVIVVTHMPIFADAIPSYPQSDHWKLLQTYMGNLTLGNVVRSYSKVTHVVSGHIHLPGSWQVPGVEDMIDVRVVGSQRGAPAATMLVLPDPWVE